jgi:hypothetical protein
MYIIPRFWYDDMTFSTYTGITKSLVGGEVLGLKMNMPRTTWTLSIKYATQALKNAIESTLAEHISDTYIKMAVGPAFYIHRYNSLTEGTKYFMTYVFEFAFYKCPVARELSYVTEGSNHVLDGGIVIPADQADGDVPIIIKDYKEIPRRVVDDNLTVNITHKANNLFDLKLKLQDIARPTYLTTPYIVGVPDENYTAVC